MARASALKMAAVYLYECSTSQFHDAGPHELGRRGKVVVMIRREGPRIWGHEQIFFDNLEVTTTVSTE